MTRHDPTEPGHSPGIGSGTGHPRYEGDHVDYSHGVFHGPVAGKVEGDLHQIFIQWAATTETRPQQIIEGDIPEKPRAFQAREEFLNRLHDQISDSGAAVISAVTGTPGIGKTLLAAAYAWTCQQAQWPLIAWIVAETTDQIIMGLAGLADRLGLRRPDDDAATAARRVRTHLAASTQPGLLVFDNATSVTDVRDWIPTTGATRVVITSRNRAFSHVYPPVEVEVFTPAQAVMFLDERTGLDDAEGAAELADELGFLPLALAQAAALIARRRLDYAIYLELLRSFPLERYLTRSDYDPYPAGTAETILLSVMQFEASRQDGSLLLSVLGVLAPSGVPRSILYGSIAPDPAERELWDSLLADLADTSLVSFSEDGRAVLMHRLIQRVLRERADRQGQLQGVLNSATIVLRRFIEDLPEEVERPFVEIVFEQTVAVHAVAVAVDIILLNLLTLRSWCGGYLAELVDFDRAIPLLQETLADCERVLGPTHTCTLTCRSRLANAYQVAGRLAEAIQLHKATLNDMEQVLGPVHPDTLASRNNLAYSYEVAGRLDEAIRLHEATLADYGQVMGPDHPATLTSRSNLARAYQAAGRLTEATKLHEVTLRTRERLLGLDHPHTLASRYNLARAYESGGQLSEAIQLYETALGGFDEVLGGDHPYTLASRQNLAGAYQAVGRKDEAIRLLEAVLIESERLLGPEHPQTVDGRHNLAHAYHASGRLDEAIELYEATLTSRERLLDPDHPHILANRNNLAGAYQAAGRFAEAIQLLEATLRTRERLLGAEHPQTVDGRHNLAYVYQASGRLDEAIELYEATLTSRERLLDPDHPHILINRQNLVVAYQAAGRMDEAIRLYEAILSQHERLLGAEHLQTVDSRHDLAAAYRASGRLDEAIELYEATLTSRERLLDPDHPHILSTRNSLAVAYQAAGRTGEAIRLHEATLRRREQTLGAEHPDALASGHNLAAAYEAAGRLDEAIQLYESTLAKCERLFEPSHNLIRSVRSKLERIRSGSQ
ncbi:tetratricopeptide repeat protein [Actinomadura sp. ATCC 39365]